MAKNRKARVPSVPTGTDWDLAGGYAPSTPIKDKMRALGMAIRKRKIVRLTPTRKGYHYPFDITADLS